mgnify:CR=1 FL=1
MRAISDFQSYFLQIERISKNGLVRFNVCTSEGSKFLRGIVALVFRLNNPLKESANVVLNCDGSDIKPASAQVDILANLVAGKFLPLVTLQLPLLKE